MMNSIESEVTVCLQGTAALTSALALIIEAQCPGKLPTRHREHRGCLELFMPLVVGGEDYEPEGLLDLPPNLDLRQLTAYVTGWLSVSSPAAPRYIDEFNEDDGSVISGYELRANDVMFAHNCVASIKPVWHRIGK